MDGSLDMRGFVVPTVVVAVVGLVVPVVRLLEEEDTAESMARVPCLHRSETIVWNSVQQQLPPVMVPSYVCT